MGEGLFAKNLRLSFDAGFRGRHKESMGLMSGTHGSPFGRRRMCCARTAALQGRDEKQKANASRVLLQQIWHNVQKCPKTGLRQAMTGPRWSQDRPKRGSNRPRQTQDWAKTGPRQAKTAPRQVKTGPRQVADSPRRAKTGQDRPKTGQDRHQERIWDDFW